MNELENNERVSGTEHDLVEAARREVEVLSDALRTPTTSVCVPANISKTTAHERALARAARREVELIAEAAADPQGGLSTSAKQVEPRQFPDIEGYRLLKVLGRGGMGTVYLAVQANLGRTVALKVLNVVVAGGNPSAVSRFRREAAAAARLHHTNIVPVYDFGAARDGYFYAMEYIAGHALNELIPRFRDTIVDRMSHERLVGALQVLAGGDDAEQPVPRKDDNSPGSSATGRGRAYYGHVARWMADAADALHYAHGEGIIHRDIKPGNLILSTDGRLFVTDFGLAKSADEQSVTMTGSLLGTLRYMSPEQAMAKRVRLDHRTDVYSLGATMYELLCFEPAFGGRDDKLVLGEIIAREPTPPRKVRAHVPDELETICLKCLEKSPTARYATAHELAEDLRRYLHDRPIVAKRPSLVRRAAKFVRRHRAATAAVVAAFLLVVSIALSHYLRREMAKRRVAQASQLAVEGVMFTDNQQWDLARSSFKLALNANPEHVDALGNFARLKKERFNHQKNPDPKLLQAANELCDRALSLDANRPAIWNVKGVVLKKMGEFQKAIAAYEQATRRDPRNSAFWENLGIAHVLAGDLSSAEQRLRTACDLAGTEEVGCEYPWRNLAALEHALGRPEALEHVHQALECDRTDPATFLLRARILLESDAHRDLQEARRSAEFANLAMRGKDGRVQRFLALISLRQGEVAQAVEQAKAAVDLGDRQTAGYLLQAIAQAKLGNRREAQRCFDLAMDRWSAELGDDDAIRAEAPTGILWFEATDAYIQLREEARRLLVAG